MTAHDIELPPLPPLRIVPNVEPVDYPDVAQALMDYARAAIEADRQRRNKALKAEVERLVEALEDIGASWDGEAYMRNIARRALAAHSKGAHS